MTGNSVEFNFNRISDFENGKSLDNHTTIEVNYNDTIAGGLPNPAGLGWELNVRSLTPTIESTDSGETLPLNVIEMRVFHNAATTTYTLNSVDTEIATGPDLVAYTDNVIISYDIGKTNPIDIVSNERFVVDLIFTLKTKD